MQTTPRTEYPRPNFVRNEWLCLNGGWEFQFDPEGVFSQEQPLEKTIQVPFAYQSKLSGINDQRVCELVWYAKSFEIPSSWVGRNVLVHFGAVDYEATIWVNGVEAGFNRGGYVPFTLDVTRLLKEGTNRVVVRVLDTQDPGQPRGKQSSSGLPHGIDYWCTTGIWQSVWLEPVPTSYLADVVVSSDISQELLVVSPVIHGGRADLEVEVLVHDGPIQIASKRGVGPLQVSIKEPKLWSPDSPHLYDLTIKLLRKGQVVDEVRSYAGMRSVETKNGQILFNGEPLYLKMALDQGYWPESGLTGPSDQALREDVKLARQLGFNAVRKHQKVEDPRWLYWCDVEGLLVWGEMANARAWSNQTQERLEAEWERVVLRDLSHPCIIAWVPSNESMGFPELEAGREQTRAGIERLAYMTRRLDPTRPVVDNDGWEQTQASDIVCVHDYSHSGAALRPRYEEYMRGGDFPKRTWTGGRITLLSGVEIDGRPIMLTEVGGFLTVPKTEGKLDVMYEHYGSIKTSDELLAKYRQLMEAIGSLPFLSGFCYTQFTDVEQEQNGLLTYDRQPKIDPETIAEIHRTMLNAPVPA